jgi:hypothetical protein
MLAYIFWHGPKADANIEAYERDLSRFHAALATARIEGFKRSATARTSGLPWTGHDTAYEDWYLIEDSAAIDRLNTAAVSGAPAQPHDRAALDLDWGIAGLYRHRGGEIDPNAPHAVWVSRAAGMTYEQLGPLLAGIPRPSASIWQRQMVLGPGREFCILSAERLTLPAPLLSLHVRRSPLTQAAR